MIKKRVVVSKRTLDLRLYLLWGLLWGCSALFLISDSSLSWAQEYVPGEVIVRLKGNVSSFSTNSFIGKAQLQKLMRLERSWAQMNMHHMKATPGRSVEATIKDLQNDPAVLYAEPNYIFRKTQFGATSIDSQAFTRAQAQLVSAAAPRTYTQTSVPFGAREAWGALSVQASLIPIVAVLDTGVDLDHEVFVESQAIWTNTEEIDGNGLDDDQNGYIDDIHGWNFANRNNRPYDDDGHGTHVAGIILGMTQDILSHSLTSALIRIMPLKFLDASGAGSTTDAINAIYYAVNQGASIINNSWGGPQYSAALNEALAYAYEHEVALVAAAGNLGTNNDVSPFYPSSFDIPSLVSVAATTRSDTLAKFSNFGANSVHVGSPGVAIMSTFPENNYVVASGTSMAAPIVSGILALMKREQPAMNGYVLKTLLLKSLERSPSLSGKVRTGSRVNSFLAVEQAKNSIGIDPKAQPSYAMQLSTEDRHLASELANAGGCGLVSQGTRKTLPFKNGPDRFDLSYLILLMLLFSLPIVVAMYLKFKVQPRRRRYERFNIETQVAIQVGDSQISGRIQTLSLGGAGLNTEALLKQGAVVVMNISSPDGKENIEVKGRVVWGDHKRQYGVEFENTPFSIRQALLGWIK